MNDGVRAHGGKNAVDGRPVRNVHVGDIHADGFVPARPEALDKVVPELPVDTGNKYFHVRILLRSGGCPSAGHLGGGRVPTLA